MVTKRRLPIRDIDPRALFSDVAVDASNTYLAGFAFDESPRLVAIAHGATAPHLVVAAKRAPPLLLLACDDALLIAAAERRIVRVDTRTGALSKLVETPVAMTTALALDHDWIYGTVIGPGGGVFRAPRSGGALSWVHRGRAVSLAVSRGRVAFGDGDRLWLKESESSVLRRLADPAHPHSIAFLGDEIFWTEFTPEGSLCALDLATGLRRVIAASPYSSALVALGGHLYWAQSSRNAQPWLWRVRPDDPSSIEPILKGRCKRGHLAGEGATLSWFGDLAGGAHALDLSALASRS
ncbi:MAG: hypothetical protein U0326_39890 [Polyangiales bacterium]